MGRAQRTVVAMLLAGVAAVSFVVAVNCSGTEDTSVNIVTTCDLTKLDTSPAEATVTAYVGAANQLLDYSNQLQKQFQDVCNAINNDLGQPTGANVRDACNGLATRIDRLKKFPPIPDGGVTPQWQALALIYPRDCDVDPTAESKCIDACSGQPPCDVASKCPPAAQAGQCSGKCTGVCITRGTPVQCAGECRGEVVLVPMDAGPLPPCSNGACTGKCPIPSWQGRCDTGCDKAFVGQCQGTCSGTCDGNPVGPPPEDAGVEGGVDASPPTGADGNCGGLCKGQCSAKASGLCSSKCQGQFSGGFCPPCNGNCETSGNASESYTPCNGECRSVADTCSGQCLGGCSVPLTNAGCTNDQLTCEANDICKRTCRLKGGMAAKCVAPFSADLRVAGDYAAFDALRQHLGVLLSLLQQVALVRPKVENFAGRTSGDFHDIGVRRDEAYRCAAMGNDVVAKAREAFNTASNAAQVTQGLKF